jgi:hypothetical protein
MRAGCAQRCRRQKSESDRSLVGAPGWRDEGGVCIPAKLFPVCRLVVNQSTGQHAATEGFTAKVIWSIVREAAVSCSIGVIIQHDLRRTCARLCHQAGGELEQIQFLLGLYPYKRLSAAAKNQGQPEGRPRPSQCIPLPAKSSFFKVGSSTTLNSATILPFCTMFAFSLYGMHSMISVTPFMTMIS